MQKFVIQLRIVSLYCVTYPLSTLKISETDKKQLFFKRGYTIKTTLMKLFFFFFIIQSFLFYLVSNGVFVIFLRVHPSDFFTPSTSIYKHNCFLLLLQINEWIIVHFNTTNRIPIKVSIRCTPFIPKQLLF